MDDDALADYDVDAAVREHRVNTLAVVYDAALAAFDIDAAVSEHRHKAEAQRQLDERRRLLSDVEDHIGDVHHWPHKEQHIALTCNSHVRRGDVFRLTLFLLGNRAPPRPVAVLLLGLGILNDAKRKRDAWDAFRAFRDGTLKADAFYWNMEENTRTMIHGSQSWCAGGVPTGMRDPVFWDDAQRMLGC